MTRPTSLSPLQDHNRYRSHRALVDAVRRSGAAEVEPELEAAGAELGRADWIATGEAAERHPPRVTPLDRFGERSDSAHFHPAWHACLSWLKQQRIAGAAWRHTGSVEAVRRAALFQLFAEVECGSLCPATMSHAAVPLLQRTPALHTPWLDRLLAPDHDPRDCPADDKTGLLIGMGLTERQGGSDVRANTTRAIPAGKDGWYSLDGHKWFLSVPMSDAFFVTAQAPGGLSCFFLPRYLPDGRFNAPFIVRAKNKLGDRANASVEVEFRGQLALLVGEEGRGVGTILEMGNHTRLDCAHGSAGIARAALAQALHHARQREAFGVRLVDHALMRNVLADLALEVEGMVALTLHVAALLAGDDGQQRLARLLIPATKYWVCKRTPALVAEAMEVTGGNGYVEDGPMPRLYRQAPLNSIWEGAGNIMCLDVLRVLAREPASGEAALSALEPARGRNADFDRAFERLARRLSDATTDAGGARTLCGELALLVAAAQLLADTATPVAHAFCASRLGQNAAPGYGTLGADSPFALILERAGP